MKGYKFYVFGYRDQCFWEDYGPIVRDLMITLALLGNKNVVEVNFFNRPVSIHERILGQKSRARKQCEFNGIKFFGNNSYDIFGPIKKRQWLEHIYCSTYKDAPQIDTDYCNIVLDFLPIGYLPKWAYELDLYWYDLIDNFKKHNRYTEKERVLVGEKYSFINKLTIPKLITGVSKAAVEEFTSPIVLENAILSSNIISNNYGSNAKYDFGFMGFITDKFDISVIKEIASLGYTVAIYGESYDPNIINILNEIEGVFLFGKFNSSDVPNILSSFKVGLIPYINEKLHDESPLKLYQYLTANKPVLSSFHFDFENEFFHVYSKNNVRHIVNSVINQYSSPIVVSNEVKKSFLWESRIDFIMNELGSRFA